MSAARRTARRLVTPALLLAGGALIYWALVRQSVVTCEVCVHFDGRHECASASAPTADDARGAAQRNACGRITRIMDRELACIGMQPSRSSCEVPAR